MLNLNAKLKNSIKTNQLVINILDEDYTKINTIIGKLKVKYQEDLSFF